MAESALTLEVGESSQDYLTASALSERPLVEMHFLHGVKWCLL